MELLVIALSVSHGLDGAAVAGAGEAATDDAGAAAIAPVETEQSETATATAVKLRMKADIKLLPVIAATISPYWFQFPPRNAIVAEELQQFVEFRAILVRLWLKCRVCSTR